MMPRLAADGLLVAGDAAALCLAAGIWLEGVNFAIGSGLAAGRGGGRRARGAATRPAPACRRYRERARARRSCSPTTASCARAPHLVLSDRVQQQYPS